MDGTMLPDISTLPNMPLVDRNQTLDTLFEPSEHLHSIAESLLLQKSCTSYQALIDFVRARLIALASSNDPGDRTILLDILGSHPRLGEKAPASNSAGDEAFQGEGQRHLNELSKAEQANINRAGQKESAEQLIALNREYEEKFPGLRYVTFVNGRGRDAIMEDMRRRIDQGDLELEILETIQSAKIAVLEASGIEAMYEDRPE
ncbi:hypothetical protein PRK78_006588 [Emydomyces testavorans]|uniref:Oxo-4-hydroxy-4-carboxy-5-ureidoimidazoline decarboxylase domain-containing protein n=1 Tax=Emydomyces testavorans TaxID=2070801 RepID=A0AAF0DMP3_9EURO|nr:hypothetical protein PRK78_006588 [Emydomyces testavorans]